MPQIIDASKGPARTYEGQAPQGSMDTDTVWLNFYGAPPFNTSIKFEGDASVLVLDGTQAVFAALPEPRSFQYTRLTVQLYWHLVDSDLRLELIDASGHDSRALFEQAGPVGWDQWHQRTVNIEALELFSPPGVGADLSAITYLRMTAVNYTGNLIGKYMLVDDLRGVLVRADALTTISGRL